MSICVGTVIVVTDSPEVVRAFLEAKDIAKRADQHMSSAHLLLALFTFSNRAQALLIERGIDEDTLLKQLRVLEDEPKHTINRIRERSREIAKGSGSQYVDCLHILIAITRFRDAFAYHLMERTGISLTSIRNLALSYVTGNMPRRYQRIGSSNKPLFRPTSESHLANPTENKAVAEDLLQPDDGYTDEFEDLSQLLDAAISLSNNPAAPAQPEPAPSAPQTNVATQTLSGTSRLEELAPTLASCSTDLSLLAKNGELDMAVGRERELESLIDILGKRRSNNPILVGPPGVGKTAIVEGLALKIARGDPDVSALHDRILCSLDVGALVAGTSLRGAFSERLGAIKNEVAAAKRQIIVFIDEIHTLVGAGTSGESAQDAANELKASLARGEFTCIGATTNDEFRKHIEKDPALERRFTPIHVDEPTTDEAILILEGSISAYAEHHRVDYTLDSLHAAVNLTHRFMNERNLPEKAFAVIDLAGSRARRREANHVERIDIARVIHEWTGVPLERLAEADSNRFAQAESRLAEKLIGQSHVIEALCRVLRRGLAGFNEHRPLAGFLFLGPTGVGKTELVKVLADFLFGQREAILRIDMSEFAEKHSVARLLGAQPGYVGFDDGGQLTESLRKRPFQVVLFDEIEKAHPDVLNLLLQILDEGHLSDSRSRRVSFANTVVILTSNLGADSLYKKGGSIGFGQQDDSQRGDDVLDAAKNILSPELWGRLDEKVVFYPLKPHECERIAGLQLESSAKSLFSEREITLSWDDEVLGYLVEHGGYDVQTGARGMRQAIQRHVEGPLAERILSGEFDAGNVIHLSIVGDQVHIERCATVHELSMA
ncbi:MAG: AAA family ATPase [Myxococcales bacterium]|nr:AAA family ATPase [Myxococcales bacterium]